MRLTASPKGLVSHHYYLGPGSGPGLPHGKSISSDFSLSPNSLLKHDKLKAPSVKTTHLSAQVKKSGQRNAPDRETAQQQCQGLCVWFVCFLLDLAFKSWAIFQPPPPPLRNGVSVSLPNLELSLHRPSWWPQALSFSRLRLCAGIKGGHHPTWLRAKNCKNGGSGLNQCNWFGWNLNLEDCRTASVGMRLAGEWRGQTRLGVVPTILAAPEGVGSILTVWVETWINTQDFLSPAFLTVERFLVS